MLEIPIGKALAPVIGDKSCNGCCLNSEIFSCPEELACSSGERLDDNDIIFKLVDYMPGDRRKS